MIRVCGNVEDAEDALVESLLAAYKAISQLSHPDQFQAWLAAIARRVCIRIKRNRDLAEVLALSERGAPLPSSPESEVIVRETKSCIERALNDLPQDYREVYTRREVHGERAESVARELGISVSAVKSRLHRARKVIRENLERNFCITP